MTSPSAGPGWYDDPHSSAGPLAERYWDGTAWTPRRRPKKPGPSQPAGPQKVHQPEASPQPQENSASAEPPPAGWYDNPDGSGSQRWWDGSQWTSHRRDPVRGVDGGPGYDPGPQGRRDPSPGFHPPYRPMPVPQGLLPDPAPVERGSNRWIVGLAMLITSVVLALTSFGEWANLTYTASDGSYGQLKVSAALSGFGSVSVDVSGISNTAQRGFVERQEAEALEAEDPQVPGVAVLTVGLLMAGAAWAFLQSRRRLGASIVIIVLSTLGLINGLWRIANVRGMFNDPAAWSSANYSPGFGLMVATIAALALVGLGVTALILERRENPPSSTSR